MRYIGSWTVARAVTESKTSYCNLRRDSDDTKNFINAAATLHFSFQYDDALKTNKNQNDEDEERYSNNKLHNFTAIQN